jgi:hypothetical protein
MFYKLQIQDQIQLILSAVDILLVSNYRLS